MIYAARDAFRTTGKSHGLAMLEALIDDASKLETSYFPLLSVTEWARIHGEHFSAAAFGFKEGFEAQAGAIFNNILEDCHRPGRFWHFNQPTKTKEIRPSSVICGLRELGISGLRLRKGRAMGQS